MLTVGLTSACAGGRFVRPSGVAAPFPDGVDIWTVLSRECRTVAAMRAELRVSGRVAGQRFPTLTTGVVVDAGRLAIAATAGARSVFHLAGDRDRVVLLNYMDATTTRGPADDVVEALVGLRLEPARLLSILSGCAAPEPDVTAANRVGAYGRLRTSDTTIYLREHEDGWRLAAAEFGDVVVDYRRIESGMPAEVEVRRGGDVELRLRVIEFDRNPELPESVFSLRVPESFVEVSVDQLRRDGPLAGAP